MVTTRRGASSTPSSPSSSQTIQPPRQSGPRTPPFLPTPIETATLALFPAILVFGALYSVLNPQTRSATFDPLAQAYVQDPGLSPNYFARKANVFNVLFVKRAWAWTTAAFVAFAYSHPSLGVEVVSPSRLKATVRWALVTTWWILVTQWCFGAPLIDRGFRWTGGKCQAAFKEVEMGEQDLGDVLTSVACKAAGGKWGGGHDISGHVFILVLGTTFLLQEVGWPLVKWMGLAREERDIVMGDGALKSASVESNVRSQPAPGNGELLVGGKFALGVIGLKIWMLLMTAIYFHTWFEKLTGLLTAFVGFYAVYIFPRFVPGLRQLIGVPGN